MIGVRGDAPQRTQVELYTQLADVYDDRDPECEIIYRQPCMHA